MLSVFPALKRVRDQNVALPPRVLRDQGLVNACFSCATAAALEARDITVPPLAPEFHFGKATGGNAGVPGIDFWHGQSTLASHGIASHAVLHGGGPPSPSSVVPVVTGQIRGSYDSHVVTDAAGRRLTAAPVTYRSIQIAGLFSQQILQYLREEVAVLIAFATNAAYWRMDPTKLGSTSPPTDHWDDAFAPRDGGNHVACVIGYLSSESAFVVQDSRGPAFGRQGQWLLPTRMADSVLLRALALRSRKAP